MDMGGHGLYATVGEYMKFIRMMLNDGADGVPALDGDLPQPDARLVDAGAAARVAHRLPQGELVAFGRGCAHEILREADPIRANAFAAITAFLDRRVAVTSSRSAPTPRP